MTYNVFSNFSGTLNLPQSINHFGVSDLDAFGSSNPLPHPNHHLAQGRPLCLFVCLYVRFAFRLIFFVSVYVCLSVCLSLYLPVCLL